MSSSSVNATSVILYPDSFGKAVAKNVLVVAVGITIVYINASLIHTFSRHQVSAHKSAQQSVENCVSQKRS